MCQACSKHDTPLMSLRAQHHLAAFCPESRPSSTHFKQLHSSKMWTSAKLAWGLQAQC